MTALANNISRPYRDGNTVSSRPVAAGANVRQGSYVEIDAAGHVAPGTKAVNKAYYGVALTPRDNTGGAAGAGTVTVRRIGSFHFSRDGTAEVGKLAYLVDDNTVTDVAAGASVCGLIIDSDADGVWVDIGRRSA